MAALTTSSSSSSLFLFALLLLYSSLSFLSSSSRSRSRSRSHSPSHRNYPTRDYQNNRGGYRGYNRGYRRPFNYRGRSRGFFPNRGRYQSRGGGNYGYRANNWQGGGNWQDHHHDQDHHSHSPRRGRSRTPRKRSHSYSDRSSSGHSRHSRRSSYSSRSRSLSPRRRSSKKHSSKDAKERPVEGPVARAGGLGPDGSAIEKASGGKWIDYDASPKQSSPQASVAAGAKEDPSAGSDGQGPSSGGPMWKTIGSVPATKSPTKTGPTASFSGFGFFSKEDSKTGDKTAISSAFKK